ncbi:RnfABCDGE type electron transport complex subunit D [Blastopirellula sp. JC732]|uniref:Ion-translocating oxidoreductase complex subunit D n=1 Tax=Blastopirellula sediminis TaxID=2894196 RepID=A0A9X1SI67_9BACT|nr:RnfABCDGE type electron transport complex subunit D [Blastopirellula sediminis]MCC9609414.1 RnfABCDGE type electron transport complex subunit D [Blastopirellula sediminis]MCC9627809.1 RnfABCDGE type electron transport complex subunit D [Blastopirellula sediminis]
MKLLERPLTIRMSPHIGAVASVDAIMFNVVLALTPVVGYAIYLFGIAAILVIATATFSCVLSEHLLCKASGKATTIGDGSAVITGLLFGLTLPPSLPLWMAAVGGVICIAIGKYIFGGLGFNPFNPALVGRAIMQATFPAPMTTFFPLSEDRFHSIPTSTFAFPFTKPLYDGLSGATPLADWKFNQTSTAASGLLWGNVPGSTGETCAVLIILGGAYLVARGMMSWRIPVSIFASVAVFSGVLHLIDPDRFAGPLFMLLSGGLVLGAVFMATDMVSAPITPRARIAFGILIGVLTVTIRVWGGASEGVMYAILIGNALSPHLDGWLQPRLFGRVRESST